MLNFSQHPITLINIATLWAENLKQVQVVSELYDQLRTLKCLLFNRNNRSQEVVDR